MSSFEAQVPDYYIVRQGCSDPETEYILTCLKITPILATIITDVHDAEFALRLSTEIFRTPTLEAGHQLARNISKTSGRPVLLIGDSPFLTGVMADGTRQELAAIC